MADESEMTPAQRKLFELRMKVNAGRKANKQEVAAEHERIVNKDKKAKKEESTKRKQVLWPRTWTVCVAATESRCIWCVAHVQTKMAEAKDVWLLFVFTIQEKKEEAASGNAHLKETAEEAEVKTKKNEKKEKRKAAFGWDVFNQDSLFKGYKKRLANLPTHADESADGSTAIVVAAADMNNLEDELSYGKNDKVSEENLERMAQELEERIKARKKFSRRRQHYEGEDVDYINDQNRLFNRKAKQAFDKYTVEIRQNLERGTAL